MRIYAYLFSCVIEIDTIVIIHNSLYGLSIVPYRFSFSPIPCHIPFPLPFPPLLPILPSSKFKFVLYLHWLTVLRSPKRSAHTLSWECSSQYEDYHQHLKLPYPIYSDKINSINVIELLQKYGDIIYATALQHH